MLSNNVQNIFDKQLLVDEQTMWQWRI